jgi:hypothetical protein
MQCNKSGLPCQGIIILQDKIRAHPHTDVLDWLWPYALEVMDHPLESPDLVPSDFHFFRPLRKQLAGKQFVKDADMQQAVTPGYDISHKFPLRCNARLLSWWDKANDNGD